MTTAVAPDERRSAVSKLAVLHHGALFGYCRRRLGADAEAEDALQETFLRAYKYYGSLDQSRDARKWLFGIAHNVCVEVARARGRSRPVEEFPELPTSDSVTGTAIEKVARQEHMEQVKREINRMSDKAKRILELRFFGQMDAAEIASLEGMTETAVRVSVHRALETLREKLASR